MKITHVLAREILDSRGKPTVEVEVHAGPHRGLASAPSGASTGSSEALELRDRNDTRYDGQGVLQAVRNVNSILAPAIRGLDPADQRTVDERLLELDPSPQKSRLGGNAILAVSMATAHCGAAVRGVPLYRHLHAASGLTTNIALPLPMTNMISGGLHAGGNLDFQDILVMPIGTAEYSVGLEWIVRIYRRLGLLLSDAGYEGRLVGDEGGFGPRLTSNREAVEFVVRAIEAAGLRPGSDVTIAIDVAATHFFEAGHYRLKTERDRRLTRGEMVELLAGWVRDFPITSIEDGLAEDDWDGWREATARLGGQVRLVGDDFFTTNPGRIRRGIELGAANSVLIKMNQIGTLSETFEAIRVARSANYGIVVSARSGETEDTTMSDLAVAVAADYLKVGSIVRSERLAKYNRLLRIAEELA